MLRICEIFKSIQGESSYTGHICSFVRLTGCNLHCSYCDTLYAATEGSDRTIESVIAEVETHGTTLVEITGGEPLLQAETPALAKQLLAKGYTVLIETNGTIDISSVPLPIIRVVDIKCPGSGHEESFNALNFAHLRVTDECKFVLSDRADFDWALKTVYAHDLHKRVHVIFSPNMAKLEARTLAEWVVKANAPVRFGVQLHKLVWGDKRGV